MTVISSNQNDIVKILKSLKLKKYREDQKLFFIEGSRFVEEALATNAPITRVLVSQDFLLSKNAERLLPVIESRQYPVHVLTTNLFNDISDTSTPQGILAVVKQQQFNLEDVLGTDNFIVVLDSIQDPGNMGTIIRTADAAGVSGIVISKGCVDLYNPKVLRSTMGSVFRVPVVLSENLPDALSRMKSKGTTICAAHLQGTMDYFHLGLTNGGNIPGNIAIIIGNEANGISDEVRQRADLLVKIPMAGQIESLNASVAAGLLMYEVVRCRKTSGS